jgi:hypothetical protein
MILRDLLFMLEFLVPHRPLKTGELETLTHLSSTLLEKSRICSGRFFVHQSLPLGVKVSVDSFQSSMVGYVFSHFRK